MSGDRPRTLVIGASGFVGRALVDSLRRRGWEVLGTHHTRPVPGGLPLDIRREAEVAACLARHAPVLVALCAADPNVDYCETHPREAAAVNVEGTAHVAATTARLGARLVYFSSDYVFDGTAGPYRETDLTNPLSEYGRQKVQAEALVRRLVRDSLILRVTVLYGWEAQGKNFLERLVRTLRRGESIRVPTDQWGNPTLVTNMTAIAAEVATHGAPGVYHVAGPDWMDRCTFARRVADIWALDASKIIGVPSVELGQVARRPLRAGMLTERLAGAVAVRPMGVAEGLAWLHAHPGPLESLDG